MGEHFGNDRAARNEKKNGLEHLQTDLDKYMKKYNKERTHHGKRSQGGTPMETFMEGKRLFDEKNLDERLCA